MPVRMVDIRRVRMNMPYGLMPMHMAVWAHRHRVMNMRVMPVVMHMRMLVFQRFVLMLVRV